MKNELKSVYNSLSPESREEFKSLWVKAILLWLLNVVFSITVLCGLAYLITRVVMFAIGQ
jgi:hypothetical protein